MDAKHQYGDAAGAWLERMSILARLATWHAWTRFSGDCDYRFVLPNWSGRDYLLRSAVGGQLVVGGFEATEVAFLRSSFKPGNVVFDIGANGGVPTTRGGLPDSERPDQRAGHWQPVETLRQDDEIEQSRIRAVNFIKMNIEGAEKLVPDHV